MTHTASVQRLFNEWALEDGAEEMSRNHWPRVHKILSQINPSTGRYLEIGSGNGYSLKYMAETRFSGGDALASISAKK